MNATKSPPATRRRTQDIDREIGQRIKELRVLRGFSRSSLSAAVGITHQQLHKYENGVNRLSISRLFDLASALGVEMEELLKGHKKHEESGAYPRLVLEMMRDFQKIPNKSQQEAIRSLIHTLANIYG